MRAYRLDPGIHYRQRGAGTHLRDALIVGHARNIDTQRRVDRDAHVRADAERRRPGAAQADLFLDGEDAMDLTGVVLEVLTGRDRHELACSNCGAPLHDLKMLKAEHPGRSGLVKPSPVRKPSKPESYDKPKKYKKKKRRKSLKRKIPPNRQRNSVLLARRGGRVTDGGTAVG